MAIRGYSLDDIRLSRRRMITLAAGAVTVSAFAPLLAACDDDDDEDDVDDTADEPEADGDDAGEDPEDGEVDDEDLEEAMEQAEEETDVELDALDDDDGDDERTFPDDFPDNVPVPDDAEIILDMSSTRDDEREIYIAFVSDEDRVAWLDRYEDELPEAYEMDSEHRNDDLDTGEWDFHGHGWEWARVQLSSPGEDHEGEFQVLVILRDYEP